MKLKIFTVLFIFILLSLFSCSREINIPVIVTTDIHGALLPEKEGVTSLASAATFVREIRGENDNLLLLDNGDVLQGTPALYYFNFVNTKNHKLTALMNYLKYDAATIGNHDIEAGKKVCQRIEKKFKFPWLSANIIVNETGEPLFLPYTIIEREKVKIAILGLTTRSAQKALKPEDTHHITVTNMIDAAKKWIGHIQKKERPDVIIGLFHEGMDISMDIAKNVSGFDIIFTGHDHLEHNRLITSPDNRDVLILGAKDRGISLAFAQISIRSGRKKIKGEVIPLKETPPDIYFMRYGKKYSDMVKAYESRPVSVTDQIFKTYGDNELYLNLLHDTHFKLAEEAQISIVAPLARDASIGPGKITNEDLFKIYPFDNYATVIELTGREINDLLEYSKMLQRTNHERKRYYNDLSARYKVKTPLNKEVLYKVVMNSYHARNGGRMLSKGAGLNEQEIKDRTINIHKKNIREHLFK